jgi:hypothetical protein
VVLLFDDSKKLEKALGIEAASVIAHVFEKANGQWRQDLATKADLVIAKNELQAQIANTKHDILRWVVGGFIAQSALLIAVPAFLR